MPSTNGPRGRTLSLVTSESDAAFYAQRDYSEGPVLVLGAADGRIAFEIASRGPSVVAVDPSPAMISLAEARKANERVDTASRVRLMHADLRSLRLSESFEAVVAPQNALGLLTSLDDLDAFFETARSHLRPSGTLLFDLVNPSGPALRVPSIAQGPNAKRTELRKSDAAHEDPPPPLTPAMFVPHLHERTRAESTEAIRRLKTRPFSVDEVDEALNAAGFVALERFGNFAGKPFEDSDELQVVVATLEPYGLKH